MIDTIHIRKFDSGYSRRHFLKQITGGLLSLGVLMPLHKAMAANGEITKAYPDELLSIDDYTKNQINTGDLITSDNVDKIKELLDPIRYHQIAKQGRVLRVAKTSQDIMRLSPYEYVEATFRNQAQARFSDNGNVVTLDGKPWIGGNPFPNPGTALEIFAGLTLSWGRHDASLYSIKEFDIDSEGDVAYEYETIWAELSPTGRLVMEPKPYWNEHADKLRFQSVIFTAPNDIKGTSFLNIWPYDQNQFPELYGYLPSFKRIRRYPSNQRFEPLVPGSSLYLSDAWAAGDPFLTWGDYKIVHQGPALAGISNNWNAEHPNWEHSTHGGPQGNTFWDTDVELVPEAVVVEAKPVKFPRAPISKKQVWFDARTLLPFAMVSFDRQGKAYRSFDGSYSLYEQGQKRVMDGNYPYWSWTHVHAHNIQTNTMTRLEQVFKVKGNHQMRVNDPAIFDKYLTRSALRTFN